MKDKLKIAFIYHKNNIFLSGQHFDNTYYHFFIDALKRSNKFDIKYFPTENYFDVSRIREKFEVIRMIL